MLLRKDNPDESLITVVLAGDEYVIRGVDAAHLAEVAAFVESRLAQVGATNSRLTKTQQAMLVALHLADDLLRLSREHSEIQALLAEAR